MDNKYEEFLKTLPKQKANSYKGLANYDYNNCTVKDIEKIITEMKPNSYRATLSIYNLLIAYSRFIDNKRLEKAILLVRKKELWKRIKPKDNVKFISFKQFNEICIKLDHIDLSNNNKLYYKTLFKSVYEGIYNGDMSVLKNLRKRDINGNTVDLRPDEGVAYSLEISDNLARDLVVLSSIETLSRENGKSTYERELIGEEIDSCFKIVKNKSSSNKVYYDAYARILRVKVLNECLGHALNPKDVYISGIMYRISQLLKENGFLFYDAFGDGRCDSSAIDIVEKELKRCNHSIGIYNFKDMIRGYEDVFVE